MKIWKALACAVTVSIVAFTPGEVEAQATRTITCESQNDRLQNCRIPNLDEQSVRLVRRLSSSACVNGRSWGTQPNIIWVESGCRAEFEYRTRGMGGGDRREITCESQNDRLQNCRVPGLNEQSVRLERTLSSSACVNGRTWGTQPNIIWVESGCRAVFSYESGRGGGFSQANNPNRRHEINCESRNNRRENCRIADLDLGSVRIEDNMSSTPCNRDENWGTQRGLIWVDRGCRAKFSYRINR